ncbi:hypothetical protein GCM10009677_08590 [Sphaerisporangium rubeum]
MVPRSTHSPPIQAASPAPAAAVTPADTSENSATLAFAVTRLMSAGSTLGMVAARDTL